MFRVLTDVGKRWALGSEADAGAGLLSSLQGSPCPLLPSVLRSTAFLEVLQCSLLFLRCSSATCSLCAWKDSPFAGFTGQSLSSFLHVAQGSCGERPAPAGRVGQSPLLSAACAFEGRVAALSMKCCCVYSPVS